jgi:hypothetical protein
MSMVDLGCSVAARRRLPGAPLTAEQACLVGWLHLITQIFSKR